MEGNVCLIEIALFFVFFQINLMENFKRSTARDFRINGATLEAALREESGDEEQNDQVSSYAKVCTT